MSNQMAIRISDGPAAELVRIHAEHPHWDEPAVHYLRRRLSDNAPDTRTQGLSGDTVVFLFGQIEITLHAVADQIHVVLRRLPPVSALAA